MIQNDSVWLRTTVLDKGVCALIIIDTLSIKVDFQLFRAAVFTFKNLHPEGFVNTAFL